MNSLVLLWASKSFCGNQDKNLTFDGLSKLPSFSDPEYLQDFMQYCNISIIIDYERHT